MEYRFRRLDKWPWVETRPRRSATFKVGYDRTLHELAWEIDHLGARECTLEAGFSDDDIRLDGQIRANAPTPAFPGVIVTFQTARHGELRYGSDTYLHWKHNVRAIVLGLEALRAVDRYGITRTGEQYSGFKALGAGAATPMSQAGPAYTREQAAATLLFLAEMDSREFEDQVDPADVAILVRGTDSGFAKAVYRAACKLNHPDNGGVQDMFNQVQALWALLSA